MGKYVKYAIGEIILVMFGILLALQVNNWNEKRKVRNEMTSKILALAKNLESEISTSGFFVQPERILRIQRFLDGKLNMDSLRGQPDLSWLPKSKDDILEETIDVLIENEDRLPNQYKELITNMKSLKFYFYNYKKTLKQLTDLKRNNEQIFENNYSWYALSDSISNEKRYRNYLKDPLFRNRMFSINHRYRWTFSSYSNTIVRKLQLLYTIKKESENYTADEFREYFSSHIFSQQHSYSFKEAKKLSCDKLENPKNPLRSGHILINTSADTLSHIRTDGVNLMIPPKTSKHIISEFYEDYIKINRKNKCEAYQVRPDSFIIVE